MGALVPADPDGGGTRRYVVPALLVVGWAGLFAYSAAFLTEDLPFRPRAPEAGPSENAAPRLRAPGRRVVMLDVPDGIPPAPPPEPLPPSAQQAAPAPAAPAGASARPPATPDPASAEYVGLWGPTLEACGVQARRRGYIPATITADRARAGRTTCTFHDTRHVGGAWITAAECSDRGRHWSSQVRLTVDGDRLVWASGRGAASYVRCVRRTG